MFEKEDKGQGSKNTQYYKRKAGQFIYSKLDFLNCAFGIIPEYLDGFQSTLDLPCFDIAPQVNQNIYFRIYQTTFVLHSIWCESGWKSKS
ncbi:MAG: hypothetical protein H6650_14090 [Ardenticatenales bacterium]|nr:hypothetical protein [Ardenticatenales bacterium]